MEKYISLTLIAIFALACSFTATPTPTPTVVPTPTSIPPTPVGYGVEFPFDPIEEWGENVRLESSVEFKSNLISPERVKQLVEANGKLLDTSGSSTNIYLWSGNVPLELFYVPESDSPNYYLAYYEIWGTNYYVLDDNGDVMYISVITKIVPAQ